MRDLEEKSFLLLLLAVSVAFAWILWPFLGAILWATVLAVVFAPVYRGLLRVVGQRPNVAAFAAVGLILLIVILPLSAIGAAVYREAAAVYDKIQAGELDLGGFLRQVLDSLPDWASRLLDRFGLTDFRALQGRLSAELARVSQFIAAQALGIGQNLADFTVSFFVALYLLFFLLRDGNAVTACLGDAMPLQPLQRRELFNRFVAVIRAIIKGTVVVAAVQGALGGLMFWLLGIQAAVLWGVVMALLSLLPAVGAALVWLPVSLYLMATGALWQGILLLGFGILVIGTVDNFLRPVLVGPGARLPDYLVLISTLGGLAIFGINGLVIGPVIAAMFIAAWDLFSAQRLAAPDDGPPAG